MLQQTQVSRVIDKYQSFLHTFPSFPALAKASLPSVYREWQGLGYNRRARALRETARIVVSDYKGKLPRAVEDLRALPGIGSYTAAAVRVFAFGEADVMIETNIRAVYLHFFFKRKADVRDSEILPLIEATIDRKDPRQWFYALMDYGVYLKTRYPELTSQSAHYVRQSPFRGSRRELRGKVLKHLGREGSRSQTKLAADLAEPENRVREVVDNLVRDGMLIRRGRGISLSP